MDADVLLILWRFAFAMFDNVVRKALRNIRGRWAIQMWGFGTFNRFIGSRSKFCGFKCMYQNDLVGLGYSHGAYWELIVECWMFLTVLSCHARILPGPRYLNIQCYTSNVFFGCNLYSINTYYNICRQIIYLEFCVWFFT